MVDTVKTKLREPKEKGLTGIREVARGFVGRQRLSYDRTSNGKTRLRFDLACGITNPEFNKYSTWRHCVAYGPVADLLRTIKVGDLVRVCGWVSTEAVLNDYMQPLIENGKMVFHESLVLFDGDILEHDMTKTIRQLPLEVEQALS